MSRATSAPLVICCSQSRCPRRRKQRPPCAHAQGLLLLRLRTPSVAPLARHQGDAPLARRPRHRRAEQQQRQLPLLPLSAQRLDVQQQQRRRLKVRLLPPSCFDAAHESAVSTETKLPYFNLVPAAAAPAMQMGALDERGVREMRALLAQVPFTALSSSSSNTAIAGARDVRLHLQQPITITPKTQRRRRSSCRRLKSQSQPRRSPPQQRRRQLCTVRVHPSHAQCTATARSR